MEGIRVIKRYQNRKLYDTQQSCYVTLEEIAQIIREGSEIQVIDNKTKCDITYTTQIQLLFDQERKSTRPGNVELLKKVIRSEGGTFTSYIKETESDSEVSFIKTKTNDEYNAVLENVIETENTPSVLN